MSNPVVAITPSGTHEVDRGAVEWLWERLDANELPATHAALRASLNGENLELPAAERDRFGQELQTIVNGLDPSSPHAQALAELGVQLFP